ncbi:ATP-binding protein [Streptomyces sp. NBC_01420]|uniref:DNA gyrase subunit B n=1 Tax=Streptomyces sp. NBC_01420 TaxID=2903858 RepID=UPI003254F073
MGEEVTTYDASHIQVLEGAEAIRKRPGMYIGSTDARGLHTLVYEVADRAVNEVLDGRATSIALTLTADGGVSVADDGPGIAPDAADGTGRPGVEALLTRTWWHGPWTGGRHHVMLGLCGVGWPAAANVLSRRMTAEVRRDGVRWVQEYARGVATTPLTEAGAVDGSGTTLTFWPDPGIFGTAEVSADALEDRFRELAFLNRALDISFTDLRQDAPRSVRLHHPDGVRDFLDSLAASPCDADIAFEHEDPRMAGVMETALRWSDHPGERVRSFANSRPLLGGTHVTGFRAGLASAINAYARQQGLLKAADPDFDTQRVGEGLTAVLSMKLDRPELEGSTRGMLGNSEVRACVERAVEQHVGRWLAEYPGRAAAVVGRIAGPARR